MNAIAFLALLLVALAVLPRPFVTSHSSAANQTARCRTAARPAARSGGKIQIRIAVLLPLDNRRMFSIQKSLPAIVYAVRSERVKRILPNCYFCYFIGNSHCSSLIAPIKAFNFLAVDMVHVFFGPVCDYSLGPVATYASHWDTPVLSPGGMALDFGGNNRFSLLTRVGITFDGLADLIHHMLVRYGWQNVKILYSAKGHAEVSNRFCLLAMSAVQQTLNRHGIEFQSFMFEHNEEEKDIEKMLLKQVGLDFAIVVLCNSPNTVRNVMIKAVELGFDNGDYVFFNIDLMSSEERRRRPWYRAEDTDAQNAKARRAYNVVKTITLRESATPEYVLFSKEVMRKAKELFNETIFQENTSYTPVNHFVVAFHDAVILYALALNETLRANLTAENGTSITHNMRNRTFEGIRGPVTIDEHGDRVTDYSVLDMDTDTGIFWPVADYYGSRKKFEPRPGKVVHWGRGRRVAPPDVPECGYDNSNCPSHVVAELFPKFSIVILVFGTMVIAVAIIAGFLYKYYKGETGVAEVHWRVRWDDIMFGGPERRKTLEYRLNSLTSRRSSLFTTGTFDTMRLLQEDREQIFIKAGFYKAALVAVKKISWPVSPTRQLIMELKVMRNLQHDHIVRFLGVCVDLPNQCIVTEYCQKGSLQDVLQNQLHLDNMFTFSLIQDIVRGMAYLHCSEIGSHGNLKSSNCLVDSRFVLKITDFGLHCLRDSREKLVPGSHQYYQDKLWTAPELLREKSPPPEGTQRGDVYSFSIICQEIVCNCGPFWIEGELFSPQEIIERVRGGEGPPYTRPTLVGEEGQRLEGCGEDLAALVRRCWDEDPGSRPDFQELLCTTVKKQSFSPRESGGNLVDNLLSRMEQYANNLEAVVEERTADYLEQKKRAEKLLYQMLPRSVAEPLMRGELVQAEKFECVTIYFSDICGFTTLSAASSPMQIVDMLNELYTNFDSIVDMHDVYKVETIGDAYMVASGLAASSDPVHACAEVACMALALKSFVTGFKIRHKPNEQLKLKTGIHSGPVCGGIVGLKMPRYCLLGDTVNTASGMEASGQPLMIHMSSHAKALLDRGTKTFILEERGPVHIEGKGEMVTWWLLGETLEGGGRGSFAVEGAGVGGVHWDSSIGPF